MSQRLTLSLKTPPLLDRLRALWQHPTSKKLLSVQMKFYYWVAIMENSKRHQPSGKNLIGPFLLCSECALFDGQLNCPRLALGKTEIFESPVLTTPSLKAKPATWCPQGSPDTLLKKSAKLLRSNSKDAAMFLLWTMTPSWMAPATMRDLFVREIGTHIWNAQEHNAHKYPRTRQHVSPLFLSSSYLLQNSSWGSSITFW